MFRKFYIILLSSFAIAAAIFIASFVYLEKESHETYYYTINSEGRDIGTINIHRYTTEDKVIYKSSISRPFDPLFSESKIRLELGRKYTIEEYSKELFGNGATALVYMEKNKGTLSFLSIFQSQFSYLSELQIRENSFIFEADSPVTYAPIIENYDFSRGRSQAFNVLTYSNISFPPMKRLLTLTSIRDEYLKIESRKIKTECLIMKMRSYPQVSLWVSKYDKSIVRLEMPDKKLIITRTYHPKAMKAIEYSMPLEGYTSKNVIFKSDGADLSGTLTMPNGKGPFPGVLLVGGEKPYDRDQQGLFASISRFLSQNGFSVLRFDRRGLGSSTGNSATCSYVNEISDIRSSLEYLSTQKETDPHKIAIIGHAEGSFFAAKAAFGDERIKSLIMMAPVVPSWVEPETQIEELKILAELLKWNPDYLTAVLKSRLDTKARTDKTKRDSVTILRNRCFLKRMREESNEKIIDAFKYLKLPVLIMYGKKDEITGQKLISLVDQALNEGGNSNHDIVYFAYVGNFFGKYIEDGIHKARYETDGEVLEAIKSWLIKNLAKTPSQAPQPLPEERK